MTREASVFDAVRGMRWFLALLAWSVASAAIAASHTYAGERTSAGPVLFHVHGLVFSSDGKTILVPSHYGLAAYRDASWSEVNGPVHDFAGFAVSASALYASGHPPEGSALPDPLGLVKSTDGGETWRPLALGGEADFHLIAAGYRSNAVYVLNAQPNSTMPAAGLYLTLDEGKTWRHGAARGLEGEILGLAAHPREPETLAAATDRGLYLSRDAGGRFSRLDRGAMTAVTFDLEGKHLRYARAIRRELISAALDSRARSLVRLPRLGLDYVTHIAQNPQDERSLAIATDRRHVYITSDGGSKWRQIAKDGDLP